LADLADGLGRWLNRPDPLQDDEAAAAVASSSRLTSSIRLQLSEVNSQESADPPL
jgi:hypothetical protein